MTRVRFNKDIFQHVSIFHSIKIESTNLFQNNQTNKDMQGS